MKMKETGLRPPKKGPVFVPTIRHHQNEPTDPPICCWHQHQTKMLVCHLCFREGGQFAWPKSEGEPPHAKCGNSQGSGCTSECYRQMGPNRQPHVRTAYTLTTKQNRLCEGLSPHGKSTDSQGSSATRGSDAAWRAR